MCLLFVVVANLMNFSADKNKVHKNVAAFTWFIEYKQLISFSNLYIYICQGYRKNV